MFIIKRGCSELLFGKPFFIKMNNNIVKPLKGYNAFSKVIANGKKIKTDELTSYYIYNDDVLNFMKSNVPEFIYAGVTSSKRINKSAVIRNRIKRLLRVAVRQIIMNDVDKYKLIKYGVFIYNKKIPFTGYINLNDITPLVVNSLNKAVDYKLKKKSH